MKYPEVSTMTADHPDSSAPSPSAERIKKRLANKAFHYLSRYASTSAQLETILRRFAKRKIDEVEPILLNKIIREIIENCIRLGYIDDVSFIKSQFRQGLRSGFSQRRILLKLAQRGISRELAIAVMNKQTARASPRTS